MPISVAVLSVAATVTVEKIIPGFSSPESVVVSGEDVFVSNVGVKLEPFEEVIVDTPSEFQGAIIEKLGLRAFVLQNLKRHIRCLTSRVPLCCLHLPIGTPTPS